MVTKFYIAQQKLVKCTQLYTPGLNFPDWEVNPKLEHYFPFLHIIFLHIISYRNCQVEIEKEYFPFNNPIKHENLHMADCEEHVNLHGYPR